MLSPALTEHPQLPAYLLAKFSLFFAGSMAIDRTADCAYAIFLGLPLWTSQLLNVIYCFLGGDYWKQHQPTPITEQKNISLIYLHL